MKSHFLICLLLMIGYITIASPSAIILYINSPYRSNAGIIPVNRVGTIGGIYTSTSGLSIDSLSGAVNTTASTSGNYTVTYTIAAEEGFGGYQTTAAITILNFPNAPNLGTAGNFILFTIAGALGNTGISQITGNVGTNVGAINGFETSLVTGSVYTPNAVTAQCSGDLLAAYTQLNNTAPTSTSHTPAFGSGETLFAGVYSIAGAASVAGNLTLDAQGDPNSVFIFKIGGAFTTGASTTISLINGASACNVFWGAEGAISMAASTTMKGTLIANNGAISMGAGGMLEGRMLSTAGAASVYAVSASLPMCSPMAIWTGALNTHWNMPGNWLYGEVPTTTTNILIPRGVTYYPLLDNGLSSAQNITIQTNASVTVTGGTLQISGSISNSGAFDLSSGTLEMNGTLPQMLPANAFVNNNMLNLVISNNVTLAGQQNLLGKLSFAGSSDTLNSMGYLTLKSTAVRTAMVTDITNGGANTGNSISGNVTVERYIPALRAWRLLTAPVTNSNTIYNAWQNGGVYTVGAGTLITMPSPVSNGLDAGINTNYSMDIFNPATQSFVKLSDTQQPISPGSNGSADNIGYMIFVRGDRDPATVANPNMVAPPMHNTVLSSFGNLQTYTQTFPGQTIAAKYSVVGNPYASPVDFNDVMLHNTIKRFYAWDPNINSVGGFVVLDDIDGDGQFDKSVLGSTQTQVLQSGQAFMIQSGTDGASSISFNETSKASTDNISVSRPANFSRSMNVDLYLLNNGNTTTYADGALVQYNNTYNAAVDWQDAPKLGNMNEGIGLLRSAKTLSIERRPLIKAADTLYLTLTATTLRNYQFKFTVDNLVQPGLTATLIDSYSNTNTSLDLSGTTIFDFSVTSVAASAASNRFMIVFNTPIVLPMTFTSVNAVRKEAVLVNWKVANEVNIIQYKVGCSANGIIFSNVGTLPARGNNNYQWVDSYGTKDNLFYRVVAIDKGGSRIYSDIMKLDPIETTRSIHLENNNYNGDMLQFAFTNMQEGKYQARLLSIGGQLIAQRDITYRSGTYNVVVEFGLAIPQGINLVEIVCTDGTSKYFKINTHQH